MNNVIKKEYITVKELAQKTSLSTQAIYRRLDKDLQKYCQVVANKKVLNIRVLEVFNQADLQSDDNKVDNTLQATLQITIEVLRDQLTVKDKQIEELNNRLAEAHQMANQAQQLQGAEKVIQITEGNKKSFFNRMFGKKE